MHVYDIPHALPGFACPLSPSLGWQAPEAGCVWRQQLRQALGEQGLQSLPQAGVVALQLTVVLLLVRPNQGFVLPQRILAPEGGPDGRRCSGADTQKTKQDQRWGVCELGSGMQRSL